jgi:hypothetical protein
MKADANRSILEVTKNFVDRAKLDPINRYRSWSHCFEAFGQPNLEDDYLALQLAFYLASWGMYRGSSFLLHKDYTIHRPIVRLIRAHEYRVLRGASVPLLRNKSELVFDLRDKMKRLYIDELMHSNWISGSRKNAQPTHTLITKVMLGCLGCIPAFDRFFLEGIKSEGLAFVKLDQNSLSACCELFEQRSVEFEKGHALLKSSGFDFPPMRMLDLYFWELGFSRPRS